MTLAAFVFPILAIEALVPKPCADRQPAFFHDGTESKLPVYVGHGLDRQVVVFCVHDSSTGISIYDWPVHIIGAFDAPEELPDVEKVKPKEISEPSESSEPKGASEP